MSERKVLTKYYPPDFDPSQIKRVKGPKNAGPKVQTVRLAAPLFNARKETPLDEKYLGIQIFSGQITFKTDPKNQDYACESGAKRSTEPWRVGVDETDEERLDRLEKEEEERNAMVELEAKTVDAKREMAVADALDEIRTRNARLERANQDGVEVGVALPIDNEAERQEKEDAEAARRAFEFARQVDRMTEDVIDEEMDDVASASTSVLTPGSSGNGNSTLQAQPATASSSSAANVPSKDMPPPSFKRVVKKKKDHAAALGIKKKTPLV
ncbi:DUF572-domain-containing protein [Daldinia vernicosa]|uniref:DUF572-domain-containing protein n=1 Tax=Daldinia vernicosa TaxID=114800 RepID=UPI00200855AC|nr:DUF572-domain-containing protein [Daldinia vernicosa]KAI0849899.1 DUF572-domain-containing protein [Daldinia vernicosa]